MIVITIPLCMANILYFGDFALFSIKIRIFNVESV